MQWHVRPSFDLNILIFQVYFFQQISQNTIKFYIRVAAAQDAADVLFLHLIAYVGTGFPNWYPETGSPDLSHPLQVGPVTQVISSYWSTIFNNVLSLRSSRFGTWMTQSPKLIFKDWRPIVRKPLFTLCTGWDQPPTSDFQGLAHHLQCHYNCLHWF